MLSDSESSDSDSGIRFKTASTREKGDSFSPATAARRGGARVNGQRDVTATETKPTSGEITKRDWQQRKDDKEPLRSKEQNRERDREFNRERDREKQQQQTDVKHRGKRSESRDRKRRSDSRDRSFQRASKPMHGAEPSERQRSRDRDRVARDDTKRSDDQQRPRHSSKSKTEPTVDKRKDEPADREKHKSVNPFKTDGKATKPLATGDRASEHRSDDAKTRSTADSTHDARSKSTVTVTKHSNDSAEVKAREGSRDKRQSPERPSTTEEALSTANANKTKRSKHKKHKHTRNEEQHRGEKSAADVTNESRSAKTDRQHSVHSGSSSRHTEKAHSQHEQRQHRDSKSASSSQTNRNSKSRADSVTHSTPAASDHTQRSRYRSRSRSNSRRQPSEHRHHHEHDQQHHRSSQQHRSKHDNGDSREKRRPSLAAADLDDAMCGPKLPPHLAVVSRDRSSSPLVLSPEHASSESLQFCGPALPPPKSTSTVTAAADDRPKSSRHASSSSAAHSKSSSSSHRRERHDSHSPRHRTSSSTSASTSQSRRAHAIGPIAPTPEFLAAATAAAHANGNSGGTMSDISDDEDARNRIVVIDEAHDDDGDDDAELDDAVIGPLPDGHASKTEAHLELEKRALELKLAKFTDMETSEELVVRDEWMLELPEVRGCVTDMGLTARQFRTKERPEIGDRSGWTETPKEREHKRKSRPAEPTAEELRAQKQKEARQLYNDRRDRDQEEQARKHKKRSKRDESLMDLHQKKLKKEKRVSVARTGPDDRQIGFTKISSISMSDTETCRRGGGRIVANGPTAVQSRGRPESEPLRSGPEECDPEESAATRYAFRSRRDQVSVINELCYLIVSPGWKSNEEYIL